MLSVYELDHLVLNVDDTERSLKFYVDGLGLRTERLEEFQKGEVSFPSVRVNESTIIDLFPPALHPSVKTGGANLNHICLVAGNTIEEIEAHLAAIGAPIERGPVRGFGARGTGTSVYTRDPDGNAIEVRTYRE